MKKNYNKKSLILCISFILVFFIVIQCYALMNQRKKFGITREEFNFTIDFEDN